MKDYTLYSKNEQLPIDKNQPTFGYADPTSKGWILLHQEENQGRGKMLPLDNEYIDQFSNKINNKGIFEEINLHDNKKNYFFTEDEITQERTELKSVQALKDASQKQKKIYYTQNPLPEKNDNPQKDAPSAAKKEEIEQKKNDDDEIPSIENVFANYGGGNIDNEEIFFENGESLRFSDPDDIILNDNEANAAKSPALEFPIHDDDLLGFELIDDISTTPNLNESATTQKPKQAPSKPTLPPQNLEVAFTTYSQSGAKNYPRIYTVPTQSQDLFKIFLQSGRLAPLPGGLFFQKKNNLITKFYAPNTLIPEEFFSGQVPALHYDRLYQITIRQKDQDDLVILTQGYGQLDALQTLKVPEAMELQNPKKKNIAKTLPIHQFPDIKPFDPNDATTNYLIQLGKPAKRVPPPIPSPETPPIPDVPKPKVLTQDKEEEQEGNHATAITIGFVIFFTIIGTATGGYVIIKGNPFKKNTPEKKKKHKPKKRKSIPKKKATTPHNPKQSTSSSLLSSSV